MAYCTQEDVQMAAGGSDRLRALSDFESTGAIDPAVVADAIAEADAAIDEYLHKRHTVVLLPPVPAGIRRVSAAEAVFIMKERRGMVTETDLVLHDQRAKRLDDIAKGVRTVGTSPLPEKSELIVDKVTPRPSDKAVSRETTKGFW
jgi:phage gp36-like protein